MKKRVVVSLVVLFNLQLHAQQADSVLLKEVIIKASKIFGSKFDARNRTGSSYYISPEEIKKFGFTDVNRTCATYLE